MINFGNIYLVSRDFDKSVKFYSQLFQKDVEAQNKTRYAIFNINGLSLSIMNGYFDREHPDEVVHKGQYCEIYDDMVQIAEAENFRKIVINLCTDDLQKEHERIKELGLGSDITDIRYINARMPYYYFSLMDPDGNIVEITGNYEGDIATLDDVDCPCKRTKCVRYKKCDECREHHAVNNRHLPACERAKKK